MNITEIWWLHFRRHEYHGDTERYCVYNMQNMTRELEILYFLRLCTLDGRPVCSSTELENNRHYVAVGAERFKVLPYDLCIPGFSISDSRTFQRYRTFVIVTNTPYTEFPEMYVKCLVSLSSAGTSCPLFQRQDMQMIQWVQLVHSWPCGCDILTYILCIDIFLFAML